MRATPLAPMAAAVALLRGGGADDADAFFEDRRSTVLARQGGRLERAHSGQEIGLGVRRVVGDRTSYGFTNELDEASIHALAAQLHGVVPGETIEALVPPPRTFVVPAQQDPDAVALPVKAQLLADVERWARAVGPRLCEVQVAWSDVRRRIVIVSGEVGPVEDDRVQVAVTLRCIARDGVRLESAYGVMGGATGFELFVPDRVRAWAMEIAEQAVRMLGAAPAPAGPMTVVLHSRAGGTMVHEAIGHGLEADLVQKGLSVYHGRVGARVAAPAITVLDDATLVGRRGFLNVDDEGSPAQKTVLVEHGVLRGFMHDRLTARRDGVVSTGNGRRESYRHRPIVRMTNTLIAPGEHEPGAIVQATPHGLLVTRMGGGQVDTTTGNFVFKVNEAFLIEDGKVGAPVRGATLIGNGPTILEQIDMVGSDLGFDLGTCGKDGQGVPVADAQPTLRIPSITVGGERA